MNKTRPVRILVLAVTPNDSYRLSLDREVRRIEEGLQRSRHRDHIVVRSIWTPRYKDLRRAMLDYRPTIVHFCGASSRSSGLVFEGKDGSTHSVSDVALADLFSLFKKTVDCVVLNVSYSDAKAEEIAKHIGVVVGMARELADATALEFAGAFYDALASGKDYAFAFQFATAAIQMANLPGHIIPRLFLKASEALPSHPPPGEDTPTSLVPPAVPHPKAATEASPKRKISIDRLPATGGHFVGREGELARLEAAWADPRTHLFSIVAWGGAGKSALVNHWLAQLAGDDWRGAERVFGWSFYSQGSKEQRATSANPFFDKALRWFEDPEPPPQSPTERGRRLATLVRQHRTLLILDGLEPMQHPPGPLAGRLKDPALQALVRGLAADNLGLCLITTRKAVEDVVHLKETTGLRLELEGLEPNTARDLLLSLAPKLGDDVDRIADAVGRLPLALHIAGRVFAEQPDLDPDEYVRKLGRWAERLGLSLPRAAIDFHYEAAELADSVRLEAQAKSFLSEGRLDEGYNLLRELLTTSSQLEQRLRSELRFLSDLGLPLDGSDREVSPDTLVRGKWHYSLWKLLSRDSALALNLTSESDKATTNTGPKREPRISSPKEQHSQVKGAKLEEGVLELLRSLFALKEEDENHLLFELRRQSSGSQKGSDLRFSFEHSISVAENARIHCRIECKDLSKDVSVDQIGGKLLQTNASSSINLHHWILISPRAKPSNDLRELLDYYEENDIFRFSVQIWSPDEGIEEFFGLVPSVYYHYWPDDPLGLAPATWSKNRRAQIRRKWLSKLHPPLRLPHEWQAYLRDPRKLRMSHEPSESELVPVQKWPKSGAVRSPNSHVSLVYPLSCL